MNTFADAMNAATTHTYTENGAKALNTTSDARVDFFATIGALRNADVARKERLFEESWKIDPLATMKILFYGRDIRGGLGERQTFRDLIHYLGNTRPEVVAKNLANIAEYGRYDDYYSLVGTGAEDAMWKYVKSVFEDDLAGLKNKSGVTLLAKWLKTADSKNVATRKLGIYTAKKLGYDVYTYKRKVRALRKYIDVTEVKMTQNHWDQINYPNVPSKAMLNYRGAFARHDGDRLEKFFADLQNGDAKINAGTLYPYDLVEKYLNGYSFAEEDDPMVEAQWEHLPNYVAPGTNAIVVADTSGSMWGRPMASALGLAIYFGERNSGPYHNLMMTFSNYPHYEKIKGKSLRQKIDSIRDADWGGSTNLESVFDQILTTALENNVPQEGMPKSIIIISDMEINYVEESGWNFHETMEKRYHDNGYQIPNVIYWQADSRQDTFLADANRPGVQLVSGQSASTFKNLVGSIGKTAIELMESVINAERYDLVKV